MNATRMRAETRSRVSVDDHGGGIPQRLSFPQDERTHSWLSMLVESYFIADQGVAEGIRRGEQQGRKLACHRGCAACCRTHKTIPVYPLELVGLSWYATEKIHGRARTELKVQLRRHRNGEACPFLVDEVCSVHAMRPLACRHFNVFDRECAEGEDAFYTRRQDVLTPIRRYKEAALAITLPFYGITKKIEQRRVLKTGSVHKLARVMQDFDWSSLADKMDGYDRRQGVAAAHEQQHSPYEQR